MSGPPHPDPSRYDPRALHIDPATETARIADNLRRGVLRSLSRRGVVLGVSGGVDSAVCLGLAVRAFDRSRIVALLLPERESSPDSTRLGREACAVFGIEPIVEDLTDALVGLGCYERRDAAVREVFADYDATFTMKITLPGDLLNSDALNVFSLTIRRPDGSSASCRLPADKLRRIVAASNFKQRARAAMLYHHAELHDFAVVGTPPKNEHELGFFVKYGDGAMDVKPIAHLYKSQVFALAEHLGVPREIRERAPTSDTYPAGSTQEEFFYRVDYKTLDSIWDAWSKGVPAEDVAVGLGYDVAQIKRVYLDCARKTAATSYLRTPPLKCDGSE